MLFSTLSDIVQALSLTQGLFKPIPQLVGVATDITSPLLGATHDVTQPLLDATKGITAPLLGIAKDTTAPLFDTLNGVTNPLIGAIHDIVDPVFSPVKSILNPLLDTVKDSTSLVGLPFDSLPLLGLLQAADSNNTNAHVSKAQTLDINTEQDDEGEPIAKNLAKEASVQAKDASLSPCFVEPYAVSIEDTQFTPFDPIKANIFRYRQQQSVNLGSWFVHENWMTPSLSTCASGNRASELDVANGWGSQTNSRAVLERHWDTWITHSDFKYLAKIGINTVRLPIGYWSLGPQFVVGTDFADVADVYVGSWNRVKRAVAWAAEFDIGVLVDLHGAPGSQNGQSHSGTSTGKTGLFTNDQYMDKTIDVLTYLVQQLDGVTNIVGIQILNEPDNVSGLSIFYDRAISAMRNASPNGQALPIYVHDGFDLDRFSNYISNRSDFVVEDHHSYFVFTSHDAAEPVRQHTVDVGTSIDHSLAAASSREHRNLIIGEWSCALTDKSFEGEEDPEAARKTFCKGQEDVYRKETAGWHFWSYKMENADAGWSFRNAVGRSLPSTFFSYDRGDEMTKSGSRPSSSGDSKREFRYLAIHERRQTTDNVQNSHGYADGVATAKIFAAHGMSKLGFIDQYINDTIKLLGSVAIPQATEDKYRAGFMNGLREAEAAIRDAA